MASSIPLQAFWATRRWMRAVGSTLEMTRGLPSTSVPKGSISPMERQWRALRMSSCRMPRSKGVI